MFKSHLRKWQLVPDGEPFQTASSQLLPVRQGHRRAMLKLSQDKDARVGGRLLAWWDGDGAARVFADDADAVLIERAVGRQSLADMAQSGQDAAACKSICSVASRLHRPRDTQPPELMPLVNRFDALAPAASAHGGILIRCAKVANILLSSPRDMTVLHGDLHHGNVLDFAHRGWLAIDPKGLWGERGFDFANTFLNPDLAGTAIPVAVNRAAFLQRLTTVTLSAGLERERLLNWILAWCGLSTAWFLQDGLPAPVQRQVAEFAAAELDR